MITGRVKGEEVEEERVLWKGETVTEEKEGNGWTQYERGESKEKEERKDWVQRKERVRG